MSMSTNEKITALRQLMSKQGLDAYYVNTADPHQSEYISEHFRERAWLTGFTGSAGEALVTHDAALLWADGRYFIQAAQQIADSEFQLMKKDTAGYPDLFSYLRDNLREGAHIGVSDLAISQAFYERASKELEGRKMRLIADSSLLDLIRLDSPPLPNAPIFHHELAFTGKTAAQKIEDVRGKMIEDEAEALILANLDDIAWLFNYRGHDVPHNPVALAFALITRKAAVLFIDLAKVPEDLRRIFAENQVSLRPYEEIGQAVHELQVKKVVLDKSRINRRLFRSLPKDAVVLDKPAYPFHMKAVLNASELACQRRSALRDSAVVTRFLFQVRRRAAELNEWSASELLHELRCQGENYIEDSFETISAYGPNAAMMHYAPTAEAHSQLQPRSFYLVDCGGQYYDGTTDITRTIALGELTEEEKNDFTLTVKAHIDLARAVFLEGTSGHYLDILTRQPLWRAHMDYKCGTGHGFGYVLGVHEGPQSISKHPRLLPLKAGMCITDEPGVYKEGKHGIRLENDYVVVAEGEGMGDQFLTFDALTFVPFEREAILPELLSEEELSWLNTYHQACLEKLLPLMSNEEEREDLRVACAPILR